MVVDEPGISTAPPAKHKSGASRGAVSRFMIPGPDRLRGIENPAKTANALNGLIVTRNPCGGGITASGEGRVEFSENTGLWTDVPGSSVSTRKT
jgi:hypothetical protein